MISQQFPKEREIASKNDEKSNNSKKNKLLYFLDFPCH